MSMKLLAVGDLHLGRLPTRLPESLGLPLQELAPAGVWDRIVDCALQERVSAVLLAGDIVESDDDFFEALPRLRVGIQRLSDAGIRVLGISGNHDGEVLPSLAEQLPAFELIGAGGNWQSITLTDGGESVDLWGWSFPAIHYDANPLSAFPGRQDSRLTLGLLHCDRDQAGSRYAPVTGADLKDTGLDAWLLGHIHQPDTLGLDQPTGYLGTASPLDASETGPRGPWLITIENGRLTDWRHCLLAALRWERLDVDLTGVDERSGVDGRLIEALERLAGELTVTPAQPRAVGLRLRYTGTSDIVSDQLPAALGREAVSGLPGAEHIAAFVESTTVDLRPRIDLATLAEREDHPGLLARRLLILERSAEDPERQALIDSAVTHVRTVADNSQWRRLGTPPEGSTKVADQLRQAGQDALRAMLNQQADTQ